MSYKNKIIASGIDSESATDGHVLTADGLGGVAFEAAGGGGTSQYFLFSGGYAGNKSDYVISFSDDILQYSLQRYNQVSVPFDIQIKVVSFSLVSSNQPTSGTFTVSVWKRTGPSTVPTDHTMIESKTVNYNDNVSSGTALTSYEFVFSSCTLNKGNVMYIVVENDSSENWGNVVFSTVFEKI